MKYSIFQMDIIAGKPDANRLKVSQWLEAEMRENKPDIVVLPEMWTTAYTLHALDKVADQGGAKTKSFLKELAMTFQVNIIGGSVANQKDGKFYNSSFVYSRNGDLVYEYDKLHLVPMLNEHDFLTGGAAVPEVFELEASKWG